MSGKQSVLVTSLLVLVMNATSAAQQGAWSRDPVLPPGIRAGIEAYHEAEVQRRANVGQQLAQNELQRYGLPWSAPYGETIYYGLPQAYGYGPLSYGGAYGRRGWLGGYGRRFGVATAPVYGGYDPFLFGYAGLLGSGYYPPPIRQPIGQRQEQTGPNRWESYPVYADEPPVTVEPPVAVEHPRILPPVIVESPGAPVEVRSRRGPREF